MADLNRTIIMGRIAADLEQRVTKDGKAVLSFTVAVNGYGKDDADWIDCVAWEKTAEFICKYFKKGSQIALEGHLQTRNYEDKNGNKRKTTEVVINNVYFCGAKSDDQPRQSRADATEPVPYVPNQAKVNDEDLPF